MRKIAMKNLTYLETYVLQQDMRIRLPKAILSNMEVEKGKTLFDICFDSEEKTIILKPKTDINGRAIEQ